MIVLKKYHVWLLFLVVVVFGVFLRFYHISSVPSGMYPDETALGYNAYSILHSGKDEYGIQTPLYFRSFDDYKLPVYIYFTTGAIKLFGANTFAVRFMSAFFGSLTIITLFFLVYELSKNKYLALLTSFVLAFNPWQMFFSRAAYEVNVATALLVLGTLFFVLAMNRKPSILLMLFSLTSFVLSVYTYNVTRLISPLLLLMLIVLYHKKLFKISKRILSVYILLLGIGMLPFLISFIAMQSQEGFASHKDALLIGTVVKADLLQTRSYFAGLPGIIQKTMFSYPVLVGYAYLKNLVSFFSTTFYFTSGADHPNESLNGLGMFYYFDFPLLLLGGYLGIKKRMTYLYPFFGWLLIMFFVGSIIKSVPNGTRTFIVIIPFVVFISYGLYSVIEYLWGMKSKLARNILSLSLVVLMSYSVLFYLFSYFIRFPIELAKDWRSEDQKMIEYVRSIDNNYSKVIIDDSAEFFYTNLLFYGKIDPTYHQTHAKYVLNGLVNGLASDGKYEFRKISWSDDLKSPHTLFITSGRNIPDNIPKLATFSYPSRPVVIFYDRKIAQYPTTETAYVILTSDIK